MPRTKPFPSSALASLTLAALVQTPCHAQAVHAPPGARIEVFARVPAARAMAVCGDTLYVGTKAGTVYGVPLVGGRPVRATSGLVAPMASPALETGSMLRPAIASRPSRPRPTAGLPIVPIS